MVNLGIREEPVDDDYEMGDELGRGKFGIVNKCVSRATKEEFAAKFIRKRKTRVGRGQKIEDIHKEIEIMRDLHGHPCIVALEAVYEEKVNIIMVMELLRGTELFAVLAKEDHFSEADAIKYLKQLLGGVAFIHMKGYIHLDLKPENIVLQDETSEKLKIIDFGLATKFQPDTKPKEIVGTPEFMAPESISFEPTSYATDMWAVGVITYILLSGCSPFLGDDDCETYGNITSGEVEFPDEYFGVMSPETKDFICECLAPKPKDRLSAEKSLKHKWLAPKECKNFKRIGTKRLRSFNAQRRSVSGINEDVSVQGGAFCDVYDVGEEMARGKFGVVNKCTNKKSRNLSVAKFIGKKRGRTAGRQVDDIYREIDILKEFKGHERIVTLETIFDESLHVILVMEPLTGGELLTMIANNEEFTEPDCIHYIEQILQGVKFIHQKGYMHLDLQPSNIVLTDDTSKNIKIIDFSLSMKYDPEAMPLEIEGTPEFMAPETIAFQAPTPAVDIWAVGVTAYILVSGCSPFAAQDEKETYQNIADGKLTFPDEYFGTLSPACKDFITELLRSDHSARPSADQVLEHAWLTRKTSTPLTRIGTCRHRDLSEMQSARRNSSGKKRSQGSLLSPASAQNSVELGAPVHSRVNFFPMPATMEESPIPKHSAQTFEVPQMTGGGSTPASLRRAAGESPNIGVKKSGSVSDSPLFKRQSSSIDSPGSSSKFRGKSVDSPSDPGSPDLSRKVDSKGKKLTQVLNALKNKKDKYKNAKGGSSDI